MEQKIKIDVLMSQLALINSEQLTPQPKKIREEFGSQDSEFRIITKNEREND